MRYRLVVILAIIGFAVGLGFIVGNRLPEQSLVIALAVSIGVIIGTIVGVVAAMVWLRAYGPRYRRPVESLGESPQSADYAPRKGHREFDLVGGADLIVDDSEHPQ